MPPAIGEELRLSLGATRGIIPAVSRDLGNPEWREADGRILIVRLSPLKDVESSTSHLVLFSQCRRALGGAYIDFSFFPASHDRAILSDRSLGFFRGLESGRGAEDFDLILVSNSFALELVNLPYLYAGTGVPSRASARAKEPGCPIVILGGSNASCTGALLFPGGGPEEEKEEAADCLVDGIFFGEGEEALGELARALAVPEEARSRRLEKAGGIPGLWLALSGKKAARREVLPYPPPLVDYPVLNTPTASTAKLQISAGCPGYCSFCLEGWEFRPYREVPAQEVLEAARRLKVASGASCLEVYSYNFNAHSEIYGLVFELNRLFRRVNFMSQRLDILAGAPSLVPYELAADKKSFTLGIEGISERLRGFYRKGIDSAQIEAAVAALTRPGVRELKLFYIIAGIETEEDLGEFAASLSAIAEAKRRSAPGLRVLASAGYLVRLPFTPLQYAPLCLDRGRLEGIASRMAEAATAAGVEFRLAADYGEYFADQLLALGGRALAPWIERCPSAGIAYDGKVSGATAQSLEAFARGVGLLGPQFEGGKGPEWRPPLAFVDENDGVLRSQYQRAAAFEAKAGKLPLPRGGGVEEVRRLERLMEAKRRFASILVVVDFPKELAQACPEYRASWLMRKILAASGDATKSVFEAEDAIYSEGGPLGGFAGEYWGLGVYRLWGADSRRLAEAAKAAGLALAAGDLEPEGLAVELETEVAFGPALERALKAYLAEERISFVERKGGDGAEGRSLEASPKDAKKGVLRRARLPGPAGIGRGSFVVFLDLGPKARLVPMLAELEGPAARGVTVRILSIVGLRTDQE